VLVGYRDYVVLAEALFGGFYRNLHKEVSVASAILEILTDLIKSVP
jgi:hypothetical protein